MLGSGTLGSPAAASTALLPGVEGIFAWTPPGDTEPAVELNRLKADDGSPVWPRYRVKRITGLNGTGEPESNYDRPPGRALEIPRRSERRGKTAVFEGLIEARTLVQLREAEADLRAAFDALSGEGRIDAFWHPLLEDFEDVPPKYFEARSLTCEIAEVQESKTWTRSFVIGLRLGDRRYFGRSDTSIVELAETSIMGTDQEEFT